MQSFHAGLSQVSIRDIRQIFAAGEGLFEDPNSASFTKKMLAYKAYKSLNSRHFEVLWRAIHESPKKTLKSVIESRELLARIAFQNQAPMIALAATKHFHGSRKDPIAKVLFGGFGQDHSVNHSTHAA